MINMTDSGNLVLAEDINTLSRFATGKSGDITGENLDASWMLYFKTDGEKYTITYRNLTICNGKCRRN